MTDQVAALTARGVAATYLASTLEGDESRRRLRALAQGAYKLVYVAPERLSLAGFRRLLGELDCPLWVIDEAHCISEWGHDFRPEYLQIGELLAQLPHARVLACTATATPVVRDEILARLGLPADTPQLVRGFARPNLALCAREIAKTRERGELVDALLLQAIGFPDAQRRGAAIVYAPTRKATEAEAARLSERSPRVGAYHAGLPAAERERTQEAFTGGELDVVVATNAFGMGIDRPDVRAVIHLSPPGSIEAYYQEVGRAGRDGEAAFGLLLAAPQDLSLRRFLIERGAEGQPVAPAVVEHKWSLFLELMRWAEGGSCRHDAILRYFGDEAETLSGCGRCDVCAQLQEEATESDEEAAVIVRKALSAVARVHGRFGLNVAASLLAGKQDPRLSSRGLDQVRTFGALQSWPVERTVRLLRRCVTAGWVSFEGDKRPVVVLTEEGARTMRGQRPARLLLPPPAPARKQAGGQAASVGPRKAGTKPELELDASQRALFEALRAHRMEVARGEGVPPYVVASDRSLRDLCQLRPRDRNELLAVHGIGPTKVERYGAGLLKVIAEALP